MMRVNSAGRRYYTTRDEAVNAARAFAGSDWEDFDLTALAGALFERVPCVTETRYYEREQVSPEAVMACDWTRWRAALVTAGGLVAERWERCGGGIYHVALFETDGAASLVVTDVPEMGADMWDPGAGRGYDSDCPTHWGALDAILGGRGLWRGELADVAARFIGD